MKTLTFIALAGSVALSAAQECGQHSYYENGHCYCKKGYVAHDNECKRCPDYSFYDCTHNVCKCEPHLDWDYENFVCKPKAIEKESTKVYYSEVEPEDPKIPHIDLSLKISEVDPVTPKIPTIQKTPEFYYSEETVEEPVEESHKPASESIPYGYETIPDYYETQYVDDIPEKSTTTQYYESTTTPYESSTTEQVYYEPSSSSTTKQNNPYAPSGCGQNEIFILGECRCLDGFVRHFDDKKCVTCPGNSFLNPPMYRCDCPYGMKFNDARDYCVDACGANEIFVNGACRCRDGFVKHNGDACITCPNGSFLNPPAGRCDCFPGLKWNHDKSQCTW